MVEEISSNVPASFRRDRALARASAEGLARAGARPAQSSRSGDAHVVKGAGQIVFIQEILPARSCARP